MAAFRRAMPQIPSISGRLKARAGAVTGVISMLHKTDFSGPNSIKANFDAIYGQPDHVVSTQTNFCISISPGENFKRGFFVASMFNIENWFIRKILAGSIHVLIQSM